jgi:hypothetical protein
MLSGPMSRALGPACTVEDQQWDGPDADALLISARCLFTASMLTGGMTNAAPVPRAG